MKRYFFFWNICLCALLLFSGLYCAQAFAGNDSAARPGKCTITSGGHTYTYKPSDCIITSEKDGDISWYVIEKKNGSPLLEEILSVSIVEMSPEEADVSGVTTFGVNSRWGQAKRDGSCWAGEDFRICIE